MTVQTVPVQMIRSRRKTLSIQVTGPGQIVVRAPLHMPMTEIRRFVDSKSVWIEERLKKAASMAALPKLTEAEIRLLKTQAAGDLPQRVLEWSKKIGVTCSRVSIRMQRTRWGSCSSKRNLNFNCLLMCCPEAVIDYVVVHELCHLKEMNHSPRFWTAVEQALPEYRTALHWLKTNGEYVIARCP